MWPGLQRLLRLIMAAKLLRGFSSTSNKGAGIRVYEYASEAANAECRYQLEALFWSCHDADAVAVQNGMTREHATLRKQAILTECDGRGLLDTTRLMAARIINSAGHTTCPLCLEPLSSQGFFSRMEQAEGRAVLDLTVTQINLFHIKELPVHIFNHCPYNLGWGHHHCNVVVKDAGIDETLLWMHTIVERNIAAGHFMAVNSGS